MTQPEANLDTLLNVETSTAFRSLFGDTPFGAGANFDWPSPPGRFSRLLTVGDLYRNLEKLGVALRSHSEDHDRLLKANARMCRAIEGGGDLLELMGVATQVGVNNHVSFLAGALGLRPTETEAAEEETPNA